MVQTSVDICNNVNLDPVADQGSSDKVAQFKIEGQGSGPPVSSLDPRM